MGKSLRIYCELIHDYEKLNFVKNVFDKAQRIDLFDILIYTTPDFEANTIKHL